VGWEGWEIKMADKDNTFRKNKIRTMLAKPVKKGKGRNLNRASVLIRGGIS